MSENLEKTENRERSYGQSVVVNGHQQHRLLTLRDKRKTLRTFAERVGIISQSFIFFDSEQMFSFQLVCLYCALSNCCYMFTS